MADKDVHWGSGLPESEDFLAPRHEPLPNFSETFCFTGYDPATDLGWFFHMAARPTWHTRAIVYLPGGEDFIVAASEGDERTPRRPAPT